MTNKKIERRTNEGLDIAVFRDIAKSNFEAITMLNKAIEEVKKAAPATQTKTASSDVQSNNFIAPREPTVNESKCIDDSIVFDSAIKDQNNQLHNQSDRTNDEELRNGLDIQINVRYC